MGGIASGSIAPAEGGSCVKTRRDTCSICRFWESSTKAYLAMKADEKLTAECHFNPAIRNDDHGLPVWPRTRATDWCSKWLEKIG